MKTEYEIIKKIQFLLQEIENEKDNIIQLQQKIVNAKEYIELTQAHIDGLKWCLNEGKEEKVVSTFKKENITKAKP